MRRSESEIAGTAWAGPSTKQLLRRIRPKGIAVLKHRDLDEMAAIGLIAAKVRAVVNSEPFMSGNYPAKGAALLLAEGIPLYEMDEEHFEDVPEGCMIKIGAGKLETDAKTIPVRTFTKRDAERLKQAAMQNQSSVLAAFIDNTLMYAGKEKDFFIRGLPDVPIRVPMRRRHVVVVVRGSGYKSDLEAIGQYIRDYKPVLIGVDGGADALIEHGYVPDLIIGDMDSVSDEALRSGAQIIVHAYPDGRAPGLQRVVQLGLRGEALPAPGTSEDIAMLLAYEQQAELIVTLGTHTHMVDFLEKGRKGMASTLLVRMKIGGKLVDAKGVSRLYQRPVKWRHLWALPVSAMFPVAVLGWIHPGVREFADTIWMYVRLTLAG